MESVTKESRINPHHYQVDQYDHFLNLFDHEIYCGKIRSILQDGDDRIFLSLATDFGVITIRVR